ESDLGPVALPARVAGRDVVIAAVAHDRRTPEHWRLPRHLTHDGCHAVSLGRAPWWLRGIEERVDVSVGGLGPGRAHGVTLRRRARRPSSSPARRRPPSPSGFTARRAGAGGQARARPRVAGTA